MKVIVRQRDGKGGYRFVSGRGQKPVDGHRELVFTDKQEEAKVWNTLYAATDYICKSDTEPVGIEIVQLEPEPKAKTGSNGKGKAKPTPVKAKKSGEVAWKGEKKAS
jgi:hypothetical protein